MHSYGDDVAPLVLCLGYLFLYGTLHRQGYIFYILSKNLCCVAKVTRNMLCSLRSGRGGSACASRCQKLMTTISCLLVSVL